MSGEDQERRQQREAIKQEEVRERFELLHHVSAILEPLMIGLGIVFLVLLIMEYASMSLEVLGENRLGSVMQAIWIIFLADFLLRLVIAPGKIAYLKANWLGALSLALPFLRPLRAFRAFRALRAARAVRGASLVRLIGGVNRGMRALRKITRGRLMLYVAALTVAVVFAGAVGVLFFDRGHPDSPVQTFDDALWWSATLVTTMNSELYVASTEGRVIAFLQRLYALSIFGYITASIASYLIGIDTSNAQERAEGRETEVHTEISRLREEVGSLRALLEEQSSGKQHR